MRFKIPFVLIICIGYFPQLFGQTTVDTRLALLRRQADSIDMQISRAAPVLSVQADEFKYYVFTEANDIQTSAQKKDYSTLVYQRLVSDMQNNIDIIRQALSNRDTALWPPAFSHVLRDLKVKIYLGGDKGWNAPPRPAEKPVLIKVTVKVFDNHQRELPGYDVFVKPEYALDPELTEQFNPTTHAVMNIVPGVKKIWIEKNGRKLQTRKVELFYYDPEPIVEFILKPER